jgi:glutaredoxin
MKIDVYSSNTCQYCVAVKDFFDSHNLDFTEKNISENPEFRKELIKKHIMGVPYVTIDNEPILGFDIEKIKEILQNKGVEI